MGRSSIIENKTPYQECREELGYSREKASELLKWISADRLDRIEHEKVIPQPDEVFEMSKTYRRPRLCNYYCSNQCKIGRQYVPEIKMKNLSQIILEMLASLNSIGKRQERLIEITADGQITEDEIEDFVHIQKELERISITVETLQLWSERMLATGTINMDAYNKFMNSEKL